MDVLLRLFVAAFLTVTIAVILCAQAVAHPRKQQVLPKDYKAWSQVARCEEGGWNAPGGNYPDALGIDAVNWYSAGGKWGPLGHLTLKQQVSEIKVADRFIRRILHIGIPDRWRCAAW